MFPRKPASRPAPAKGIMMYNAHCPKCCALRAVPREQVLTGQAPICDLCGTAMKVSPSMVAPAAAAPALKIDVR